jgi:fucose 4-O-acetylase-like acetyltransferase
MVKRDLTFDILKTIGILCVILAHILTGGIIFQLRNFDVPLLVLVSGSLFYYSMKKKKYKCVDYVINRIKRLVLPTWLFLILFFICFSTNNMLRMNNMLMSFFLWDNGGLSWIIRVFVLVSFLAVALFYLDKRLGLVKFSFFLLLLYVFYELLQTYVMPNIPASTFKTAITLTVMYMIPYGVVFGIGMIITRLNKNELLKIGGVLLIFFGVMAYSFYLQQEKLVGTQDYKYPPTIYYLSYAVGISLILFVCTKFIVNKNNLLKNGLVVQTITFIGSSTLWIFLWHMFLLNIWRSLRDGSMHALLSNKLFVYLCIVIISIFITFLQKLIITIMINKLKPNEKMEELLKVIFLS